MDLQISTNYQEFRLLTQFMQAKAISSVAAEVWTFKLHNYNNNNSKINSVNRNTTKFIITYI